jgi:hypothetical protein
MFLEHKVFLSSHPHPMIHQKPTLSAVIMTSHHPLSIVPTYLSLHYTRPGAPSLEGKVRQAIEREEVEQEGVSE